MRKNQVQVPKPELDQATLELEAVRGEVATAQNEALGWAQKTKELKAAHEQTVAELDADLQAKREKHDKELRDMDAKHRNIQMVITTAEGIRDEVQRGNDTLANEKKTLTTALTPLRKEHKAIVKAIGKLTVRKVALEKGATEAETALGELAGRKTTLTKDMKALEQQAAVLSDSHRDLVATTDGHKNTLEETLSNKAAAEKEIKSIELALAHKREELDTVTKEEADVRARRDEHTQHIQEEDAALLEKLGNLDRVEKRVQAQMEALKEGKKHFSADQLFKMGIRE